ncbi:hypothetical protein [Ruminiclostridium cellulolyticum]|uniref:Uncharacterized protein n=1 Tax=Ruminiclostridium cellulolyticum (strain ATCC 35319 / DSM 5812 / JCM 6584 / H10) TaxID=394503 RepID=B8I348_RUMCH|nr:hypothetical protein [Ruminiclostridium cellulolyticum]ACL76191.1 hypothetical protein Ccel_1843 [Ruminiclostridium cellulolyticum H10]
MSTSLEIWDIIKPTPKIIAAIKENYNRLIERQNKAADFLDTVQEQDLYVLEIRLEILEPMAKYIYVLKKWNVVVSDQEIRDGFK